jgi:zinc protease
MAAAFGTATIDPCSAHPDAELVRAKAQVLRRLPMQRASVDGLAALYLRQNDLGLPIDSQQTEASRYLEVTAAQIPQAFAAWLRPDDFAQVVEGPLSEP